MKKYIVIVLLSFFVFLGGAALYAGWNVSSVAYLLLAIVAVLVLSGLGYLAIARLRRASSRNTPSGTSREASEQTTPAPTPPSDRGASHGSSGGLGGGHGHGGGILSTLVSLVFLGLLGFGGYLLYQEFQSLPPMKKHPIQIAGAGASSRIQYDIHAPVSCDTALEGVARSPASPSWSEQVSIPVGSTFCYDAGKGKSVQEFQCLENDQASWDVCSHEYVAIRYKSDVPLKVGTAPLPIK